jgi:hypothetical protein
LRYIDLSSTDNRWFAFDELYNHGAHFGEFFDQFVAIDDCRAACSSCWSRD